MEPNFFKSSHNFENELKTLKNLKKVLVLDKLKIEMNFKVQTYFSSELFM